VKRYIIAFATLLAAAAVFLLVNSLGSLNWWQRDLGYVLCIGMAIYAMLLYLNTNLDQLASKFPRIQVQLPTIDVPESMRDDLDDIVNGRPTGTQFAVITTAVSIVAVVYLITAYDKWFSSWGNFNVVFVGLAVSAISCFLITQTEWFQDQDFHTPLRIFLILTVALVLCAWVGIFMTEPMEMGGPTAYQSVSGTPAQAQTAEAPTTQKKEYDYTRTRAHVYFFNTGSGSTYSSSASSGSGFSAPKCSGKSCNGYAVVLLILLAFVLIICSALIPHFWVLACILLLTIMITFALHELRVMNYGRRFSSYRY
jgi:phosphatidylserine synthase